MNKTHLVLAVVLVLIALNAFFFTSVFLKSNPTYKFVSQSGGVFLYSDQGNPDTLLQEMGKNHAFNVAPGFIADDGRKNSVLFNNSAMVFVVVLSVNDKNTVLLTLNDYQASGSFADCQSNLGDVNTSVALDNPTCTQQIQNPEFKTILIPHPDAQLSQSYVLVSNNEVVLKARTYTDLPRLSLAVLRSMYENTDEAIRRTNLATAVYATG